MIRNKNTTIGHEKVFFAQSKVRKVMKVLAVLDIQSSITLSNPEIEMQLKGAVATIQSTLEDKTYQGHKRPDEIQARIGPAYHSAAIRESQGSAYLGDRSKCNGTRDGQASSVTDYAV